MLYGLMLSFMVATGAAASPPATQLAPEVYFVAGEFVEGRQPDSNSVIFARLADRS